MRIIHFIFFGNYFYGLCVVGLSIEASLQQNYPLNDALYYIALFAATVFYYTIAYMTDKPVDTNNLRTNWYASHNRLIRCTQAVWISLLVAYFVRFLYNYFSYIIQLGFVEWFFVGIFPAAGALYYGLSSKRIGRYSLRKIGWLKPLMIGFTWAGLVTIYPVLFYCLVNGLNYVFSELTAWLFIKNFMFVTVLSIMFDIKDYAVDHNRQLKTFVVKNGLRRTIFSIIIPLCALGLVSFVYYAVVNNFSPGRIVLNLIPFLLLIAVAYSLHRRKSILYYLIIIDGLMLVKALCGSLGILFF
jgi:hypothetical protein